jgi:hypothetical protein
MVAEGWHLDLDAVRRSLGDDAAGPLASAVDAARKGRQQARQQARAQVVDRERQSDDLTRERHKLAEKLRLAAALLEPRRLRPLTDKRKADAAGVKAVLGSLRTEVMACRAPARLGELADRATAPLADAEAIAREVRSVLADRERSAKDAQYQRQAQAASAKRAREIQQALKKSIRQARSQELADVTRTAKQLERHYHRTTTKPGEHPIDVLRDLGVLYCAKPPAAPSPTRLVERVARAVAGPPAGRWHVRDHPAVSFTYGELTKWGARTQTAIRPVLADLYAREDQLCAELGRVPRQGRPDLHR